MTEFGIVMLVSFVQFSKAQFPIESMELGMVMLESALHPEKVLFLIADTEFGIFMLVIAVQLPKALSPIDFVTVGIVTFDNLLQP